MLYLTSLNIGAYTIIFQAARQNSAEGFGTHVSGIGLGWYRTGIEKECRRFFTISDVNSKIRLAKTREKCSVSNLQGQLSTFSIFNRLLTISSTFNATYLIEQPLNNIELRHLKFGEVQVLQSE